MSLKIYIIAGEPSGDLHGAHLVRAILEQDPSVRFRGFGGSKMEAEGVILDQDIDQLSFMGFVEVVRHSPQILANFSLAKKSIRSWQPDAILYIDFPGFNMRMAKWAHKYGYKNFYYIAPQAWAWKAKRSHQLKKYIDELFCILPFEKEFFARYDIDAHYVGHPLVDIIDQYKKTREPLPKQKKEKILALLPGSRTQEIKNVLPIQLEASKNFEDHQVIIARSPNVKTELYETILTQTQTDAEMNDSAYDLLYKADIAAVSSGTATLETALFQVPQVVCFKGNFLSYHIAKTLVKVPYISLVNLIMDQPIVKELIQNELTVKNLEAELEKLTLSENLETMQNHYHQLKNILGMGGAACKTAKIILSRISN